MIQYINHPGCDLGPKCYSHSRRDGLSLLFIVMVTIATLKEMINKHDLVIEFEFARFKGLKIQYSIAYLDQC
jgi:hypothetical protein